MTVEITYNPTFSWSHCRGGQLPDTTTLYSIGLHSSILGVLGYQQDTDLWRWEGLQRENRAGACPGQLQENRWRIDKFLVPLLWQIPWPKATYKRKRFISSYRLQYIIERRQGRNLFRNLLHRLWKNAVCLCTWDTHPLIKKNIKEKWYEYSICIILDWQFFVVMKEWWKITILGFYAIFFYFLI